MEWFGHTAILIGILANFLIPSGAEVVLPLKEDNYSPTFDLQIDCKVTSENFTGWYYKDAKIKEFVKKIDIKNEPGVYLKDGKYFLYLPQNLPPTVGGVYECRGSQSKAFVRIVIRFNLAGFQENQQLHNNKMGTIKVEALSFPLSTFIWKKDNVALNFPKDGRMKLLDNGNIEFSNVMKSDAGVYEVNINWQNRNTADKKVTVTVVEKPKFISSPKPEKFIGITGYDYKFCFNVSGIPTPTLEWFKSTVQFDTTNSRYSITGNCINIAKLEAMDVAPYKCTAKNSAGEVSSVVEIERLGVDPSIDPFSQNVYKVNMGDPFELKCSGKGDPTPTLTWSKDGVIITKSEKEATLKIDKVSSLSEANYTCTVKNGLIYNGKELTLSKTISIKAITKPSINDVKTTSKVYSYVGNPDKIPLRCVFFGVPTPTVTMTFKGVTLATGLGRVEHKIVTKTKMSFGDYNCTAINNHGVSSQNVQVLFGSLPGKPTELSATTTCRTITLTWKAPLSNGNMPILQYVFSYNMTTKRNIAENIRQYKLPYEFAPKSTYKLNLTARNVIGLSPAGLLDVTTESYCKTSAPGIYNLRRKEAGPTIVIKWNPPADDGFDSEIVYKVYWRSKGSVKWKVSQPLDKSTRQFEVPEDFIAGNYEFKVTSTNKAGESRPDARAVEIFMKERPPVAGKRKDEGLSKGVIAGIVIAILLIVLITIDLFCCFFNSCGVFFCCQRAFCTKTYETNGKKDNEMEKLNKNPRPENV